MLPQQKRDVRNYAHHPLIDWVDVDSQWSIIDTEVYKVVEGVSGLLGGVSSAPLTRRLGVDIGGLYYSN